MSKVTKSIDTTITARSLALLQALAKKRASGLCGDRANQSSQASRRSNRAPNKGRVFAEDCKAESTAPSGLRMRQLKSRPATNR